MTRAKVNSAIIKLLLVPSKNGTNPCRSLCQLQLQVNHTQLRIVILPALSPHKNLLHKTQISIEKKLRNNHLHRTTRPEDAIHLSIQLALVSHHSPPHRSATLRPNQQTDQSIDQSINQSLTHSSPPLPSPPRAFLEENQSKTSPCSCLRARCPQRHVLRLLEIPDCQHRAHHSSSSSSRQIGGPQWRPRRSGRHHVVDAVEKHGVRELHCVAELTVLARRGGGGVGPTTSSDSTFNWYGS